MASPPDLERPGAIEDVDDIYDALTREGLTDKTIVDPAFGGWSEQKTTEDDRETFHRLREFRGLGHPILVSINRKNFLRELAGRSTEAALPVSLAATAMAVVRGAHVVRTHDVAETVDAATIGAEFARDRLRRPDIGVEELDVTTAREFERHLDRLDADADPREGVVRVFEVTGLAETTRARVAEAAGEAGATLAVGADGGAALLFGTADALVGTAESLKDDEGLRALVVAIREAAGR
jgi:dihydropteroate synthase